MNNKIWLIKENVVKILGDNKISRIKLDETTWADEEGNLIVPEFLLKSYKFSDFYSSIPKNEVYDEKLSLEIENLLEKPILFSEVNRKIIGIGVLKGFSVRSAKLCGIQLRFEKSEISIEDGKLYKNDTLITSKMENWTEIRELSIEEYEEIKTKLLNYCFKVKYEFN